MTYNYLSNQKRKAINAEKLYRYEIRNKQLNKNSLTSKIMSFLNSDFGIFFVIKCFPDWLNYDSHQTN